MQANFNDLMDQNDKEIKERSENKKNTQRELDKYKEGFEDMLTYMYYKYDHVNNRSKDHIKNINEMRKYFLREK